MREEININIERAITHILDVNVGVPVLSEMEENLDDDIAQFIGGHIGRIFYDDSMKAAEFPSEDSKVRKICTEIAEENCNYVQLTGQIAEMIFELMMKYPDIPSGDLVCCVYNIDGQRYFGIMKFNYKTSYIHYVNAEDGGNRNTIIKQTNALPNENQRVDECIMVNLEDFSMKILEKKYTMNGEQQFYLSTMLIGTECEPSQKEKAQKFKKATEAFSKKVFADDLTVSQNLKRAISQQLDDGDKIDVKEVAMKAFGNDTDLKDSYIEHIENAGFTNDIVDINMDTAKKIFKKHKIKTDTGIEISVPYDFYKDKSKIQFINNQDGTVSIVLKDIGKVTSM